MTGNPDLLRLDRHKYSFLKPFVSKKCSETYDFLRFQDAVKFAALVGYQLFTPTYERPRASTDSIENLSARFMDYEENLYVS